MTEEIINEPDDTFDMIYKKFDYSLFSAIVIAAIAINMAYQCLCLINNQLQLL